MCWDNFSGRLVRRMQQMDKLCKMFVFYSVVRFAPDVQMKRGGGERGYVCVKEARVCCVQVKETFVTGENLMCGVCECVSISNLSCIFDTF